jgi:hypothetical protein
VDGHISKLPQSDLYLRVRWDVKSINFGYGRGLPLPKKREKWSTRRIPPKKPCLDVTDTRIDGDYDLVMKILGVLFLFSVMAFGSDFQQAKLVDVQGFKQPGAPIIAPNNGYPVVIPTSQNMFTITVAL